MSVHKIEKAAGVFLTVVFIGDLVHALWYNPKDPFGIAYMVYVACVVVWTAVVECRDILKTNKP